MNLIQQLAEILRRPGKAEALRKQQTDVEDSGDRAMVGNLKREIAEHPSYGLTPTRLYQVLQAAEQGDLRQQHALFADMEEKDIQISSDLSKRKQGASELEWQIVPPDNANPVEKKAADQAAELFSELDVASLVLDLGDAIGHGWAQLEVPWGTDGTHRVPGQPVWTDHTWFLTPPEKPNELRLRNGTDIGEPLWPLGWVNHRHRARSGYLGRIGLHRVLVWPYMFQNYALGDLAELLEILGIPARLGKYPRGASETEKRTLLRAVTSLGHSAAGIIPESMAIEYLEAAKADGDSHHTMIAWCERAKTKAILGGTLTTGTDGGGAYALGAIHQEALNSLIASDARQYAETIRRDLLWPMAALNFGIVDRRRAPRWYLETDETEDFKTLAETLPIFVDLGAKIPLWWLHEKTGIPVASDGEEQLKGTPQPQPPAPTGQPGEGAEDDAEGAGETKTEKDEAIARDDTAATRLAALRQVAMPNSPQAMVDAEGDRDPGWDPLMEALMAPVLRELENGLAPEEILARLDTWYPALDDSAMVALVERSIIAAETIGRLEAARPEEQGQ